MRSLAEPVKKLIVMNTNFLLYARESWLNWTRDLHYADVMEIQGKAKPYNGYN